jgi:ABC-type Fe3+/spermidine/putrescine transport system ATPase subunit
MEDILQQSNKMIKIKNLSINLGNFVMKDINLEVAKGEYFVLLGPTGCGKTVLLECMVGIRKPSSGKIWIDGQDVTDRYPEERHVSYLPQDFAIFPHMTVEENISFGLKARKMDKARIKEKTGAITEALEISHLLRRRPQGLSGGEKQRVALARSLVVEPKVVFLDEPLSALDESTREKLADELRNICRRFNATFFHVSHNFEEVCQVADRAALMNTGTIEQIGALDRIMKHPVNKYVAEFTRARNIFKGNAEINSGKGLVRINDTVSFQTTFHYMGGVLVVIRPEEIELSKEPFQSGGNAFKGKIRSLSNMGNFFRVTIDIDIPIVAYTTNRSFLQCTTAKDDIVYINIAPDAVHVINNAE